MLTTTQASAAIAAAAHKFASEPVTLGAACGRVLHQPVIAERDQPPFNRVTMDGIAVSFAALAAGLRRFRVEGTQHAGDPALTLGADDHCIEVMTGAVLPGNSDCVIPVERISLADNVATVDTDYAGERNQFVHAQGSDHVKGHEVLHPGTRIAPVDVAIVASCGLDSISVAQLPSIRVISTGNELVPAGEPIADHQIRLSNGPALLAMLAEQGFRDSAHDHIVDEPDLLKARIASHLAEADILLLSGGVSMGKADFVPQVLAELGVERVFHKVSQRPGKPMWFGTGPDRQLVFALPGNPVSTMICARQYVLPALLDACGRREKPVEYAVLAEAVTFRPRLTCYLPVRLTLSADGVLLATPAPTNTSGDFSALHGTDGYVELRLEQDEFEAGCVVPCHRWASP